MEHWHPTSELVGLPGMPGRSSRAITLHGPGRGWRARRRGKGLQWLESTLPAETRTALAERRCARTVQVRAQRLPNERHAAIADARLDILTALDRWLDAEPRGRLDDALPEFGRLVNAGEIPVSAETRTAIPKVSRRMLYDWRRLRREGIESGTGAWTALIPRYAACATKTAAIDADPELAGRLESFIKRYHPRDTAPFARRWLVSQCGEDRVPSLRTVQEWMARWRVVNASHLLAETNPDAWRSRYLPAFGDAGAAIERLNQRWELDSTPADVLCTDGRHALIGAIDIYSRRVRVHVAPVSRASEIAGGLLRRCLLDWGVPETVVTDNGKDYVSKHVVRALADLDIERDVMPPYSPERKPFIERFFGTLTRGLLAALPGYTGANVAERQAIRERSRFGARGDVEGTLTAAELQRYINDWLEHSYEHAPHGGLDGRSPFEAAAGQRARHIADERALDLLLAAPPRGGRTRTVTKAGIRVEGGHYAAPELGPWVGYQVELRIDPVDWGAVYVFAGDVIPPGAGDVAPGQFVARAEDLSRLGTDRAEVAARAKAAAKAAVREGRALTKRLNRDYNPDAAQDHVMAADAERTGQVLMFPGRTQEHEAAALDEAASAHRDTRAPDGDLDWLARTAHLYENHALKGAT